MTNFLAALIHGSQHCQPAPVSEDVKKVPRPPPGKPTSSRETISTRLPDGRWNTYNGQAPNARYNDSQQRILPGGEGGARFIPPDEYKEFLQLGHGGIFDLDLDNIDVAPWRKRGADLDAFFNYGFTERTWRAYINDVRRTRVELHLHHDIETTVTDTNQLDVDLPVEVRRALGGWEHAQDGVQEGLIEPYHSLGTSHTTRNQNGPPNFLADDGESELNNLLQEIQQVQAQYKSLVSSHLLTPEQNYTLQKRMLDLKTKLAQQQSD